MHALTAVSSAAARMQSIAESRRPSLSAVRHFSTILALSSGLKSLPADLAISAIIGIILSAPFSQSSPPLFFEHPTSNTATASTLFIAALEHGRLRRVVP